MFCFDVVIKMNTDLTAHFSSRFNSGKFAVPWGDTEQVLKELGVAMIVYDPPTN